MKDEMNLIYTIQRNNVFCSNYNDLSDINSAFSIHWTVYMIRNMFRQNKTFYVLVFPPWGVFDVGGQRSQRKKWVHCFDDAKAIIYVASLNEYDQVLLEDDKTNRMQESLQLFRHVVNSRYFVRTAVILFLNKKDLFEKKIGHGKSLRIAFPHYKGRENYDEAAKYIETQFLAANENRDKSIYTHLTCATDTKQVQFVLDSVLDTISSAKLRGSGLY
ncbi:guanine nucleotide-binding protein subunit alpha [Parelaphostrongylus tenuis]|uniref:Guanine nucleotide-binding protein subunit alpha n=1 Tax=Parelaphostrongylus tenuis TaxID=148309 RepID=A0AAD5MQ78_PARTN|nr:guanine nucleotide-binding protein subunit alpha [Parelaphostrongylus tenuis]